MTYLKSRDDKYVKRIEIAKNIVVPNSEPDNLPLVVPDSEPDNLPLVVPDSEPHNLPLVVPEL